MRTRRLIATAVLAGAVPAAVLASGAIGATGTATITEKDFKLVPKTVTVTHGTVTLTLKNTGNITHALSIEKGGAKGRDLRSKNVASGKSIAFTAKLKPGRYEIYCPIDGHKSLGMKGTLVVK